MRFVYFLLFAVLVTSCAHNRLQFRKAEKHEGVEVVERSEAEKHRFLALEKQEVIEVAEVKHREPSRHLETREKHEESIAQNSEAWDQFDTPTSSEKPLNSVEKAPEEEITDSQKVATAEKAARYAKISKNTFIASLVLFIIPLFTIFSLPLFIVGSVLLGQSSRSRYITPEGERNARISRVLQIVYASLLAILVLAILAVIFI